MPAKNVTVSATFEADKAAITTVVAPDEGAGEITMATDPGAQPITDGAAAGTKIKVTATANDGYVLDEIKVTETESGADVQIEEGNVFTMPDKAVTVTAVYYKRVVNLDYEAESAPAEFVSKSRCTPTVVTDPYPVGEEAGKVMQYKAASNAGNGVGVAQYDFSAKVANAKKAIIEFDSYMSGGRINFDVYDAAARPAFSTKTAAADYNKTGILWRQGGAKDIEKTEGQEKKKYEQYTIQNQNDTGNNMLEQADTASKKVFDNWVHTKLVIDYSTDKIDYELTNKKTGEAIKSGKAIDFDNTYANYASGIEVFNWVNNSVGYMDNIEVYIVEGETQQVNIKYVDAADKEGAEIKTAETATAVKGTKYTAPSAKTATFDAAEAKTFRYSFNEEESTKTVTVGDEEDIILAFTKNEYKTTDITVDLGAEATEDVTVPVVVKGSPTVKLANEAEINETLSITVSSGQQTATDSTLKLLDGTYTYSVDDTQVPGYAATQSTGSVTAGGADNKVILEKEADPKYNVKVKTAPFAEVALQAGQSTLKTEVAAQTVTADINGEATLVGVPAGSYKANITSKNKYLKNITAESENLTVEANEDGLSAKDVSLPLEYTEENMIHGDDFTIYADKLTLIGGSSTKADSTTQVSDPVVKGEGAKLGIWSLAKQSNTYDRLIIRGTRPSGNGKVAGVDPTLAKGEMLDGNCLYAGFFDVASTAVWKAETTDNIDHIKLDICLDGIMGNSTTNVGMNDVAFKYGNTTLFTLTANADKTTAAFTNMGVKIGDTEETVVSGDQGTWVNIDITGLSTGTATVKVDKYTTGTTLAESPVTKTISNVTAGNSFTLSVVNANAVGTTGAGMAIDNLEIYTGA